MRQSHPSSRIYMTIFDILTRTTVTSILDAYDLRPESISESSWDAREV